MRRRERQHLDRPAEARTRVESAKRAQAALNVSATQTKKAATDTAVAAHVTMTSAERALQISADQLVLANERTYAAWVRTGLVSLASGLGADQLLARYVPGWMTLGAASVLVLFSAFCFFASVWRRLFPARGRPSPMCTRCRQSSCSWSTALWRSSR